MKVQITKVCHPVRIACATVLLVCGGVPMFTSGYSQERNTNAQTDVRGDDSIVREIEREKIFNDIMDQLPKRLKARIDSAGGAVDRKGLAKTNGDARVQRGDGEKKEKKDLMNGAGRRTKRRKELDVLPQKVRMRIERKIKELDKRNEEREAEFREFRKSRKIDSDNSSPEDNSKKK